jgi:very-short-patch-repair endonuclease
MENELDKQMYYGATRSVFETAKLLRNHMTPAEKLLWERLSHKQVAGVRFRRQHPIDIFIADFYCHEARLAIELDGEIHDQRKEYDEGRTADLEKHLIKVIRFTNSDVEMNIERVIKIIENEVKDRKLSTPG